MHRKNPAPRRPRGFTLVELMIVVAMVGTLSALAVYGVRKYVASSKTAEATNALGDIGKDAIAAFEREGSQALLVTTTATLNRQLCASSTKSVPAGASSIAGRKYQSKESEWSVDAAKGAGFACLKFSMDMPQYYMYSYAITGAGSSAGDSFTATAQGDLNGDGVLSLYELTGAINAALRLNTAPNLLVVRGEE